MEVLEMKLGKGVLQPVWRHIPIILPLGAEAGLTSLRLTWATWNKKEPMHDSVGFSFQHLRSEDYELKRSRSPSLHEIHYRKNMFTAFGR